ncbi:MAG: chalcone isomerase family protein [Planctomycetes bacterium]|nr:chalcone isomerase family protein [Planctomycetota bacterium]
MIRRFLMAIFLCLAVISTVRAELGPQLKIGEQVLQLNGAGVRTKTLVQIYESGLYLLKPTKDASVVLAADELMAIRVRIDHLRVCRPSIARFVS